jgi:phosphoglucomutase
MNTNTTIKFGTSGWRAILSDEFTFANVARALDAITLYLRREKLTGRPIVVGSDTRFLSEKFRQFAAERLAANGVDVLLTDRDCPTPVIAFVIRSRGLAGGINFTASHNPPEYQGIKFSPGNGAPADTHVTRAIEALIDAPVPAADRAGTIASVDPREDYFAELANHIDYDVIRAAQLRVACDVLYGAGRGYLDEVLRRAGATVTCLHNWLNPLFGGHRPEPAPENIEELMQLVQRENLDLGLSTDGDADRFGVVDKGGVFYQANQVLCFAVWHLCRNRGRRGAVVRSVATTGYLDRIAAHLGLELIEVPVGFKYIGPHIEAGGVVVGGEESGGLSMSGHVPEKDGILACALMAELVATERKTLTQVWNDIAAAIGPVWTDRVDLTLPMDKKTALLDALAALPKDTFLDRPVIKFNGVDGFKFTFSATEWILLRPSGTEPIVRCYFESDRAENGALLKSALRAWMCKHNFL